MPFLIISHRAGLKFWGGNYNLLSPAKSVLCLRLIYTIGLGLTELTCLREDAHKKVFFLVVVPLRGGGLNPLNH